ncbi:MAG: DNA internalization-related competence protein ComEC/Rec2 [Clostridia bacterium]|nr:DNA internalization-related competence protein ComEC/Rec2 [Clostridia bacterium]
MVYALSFAFLCLGIFAYGNADDLSQRPLYPYQNKTIFITGEAQEDAQKHEKHIRFEMKTKTVDDGENVSAASEKVIVTCFKEDKELPKISRGDVLTLKAYISIPDDAKNSGGFDYAKYLKSEGIYFQATSNGEINITAKNKHLFSDAVYNLRRKCASFFDENIPETEAEILKAYVLGDKTGISEENTEIFSNSGLSHVLAVSGTHVLVFLTCLTYVLSLFTKSKRKQLAISIVAVSLYVIFTGASPSAIRAGFVCVFAISGQLLLRRSDSATTLMLIAAILCAVNPLIIYSASFMLSFSAAFGILIFTQGISNAFSFVYERIEDKIKLKFYLKCICDITAVGVAANIFVIPVLICLFKEFSVMSVVATVLINPILAPLLSCGLIFCILSFISPVIATPAGGFIYLCAKLMIGTAKFFGSFSFSKVSVGEITPVFIFIYAVLVLILYFSVVEKNKVAKTVLLCSLASILVVIYCYNGMKAKTCQVSFINVGQGDCTLINAPGDCDILIDAGGKDDDFSIAENVVRPYLLKSGARDIEYVIASHGHTDHVNGLIGLMDIMKIDNLLLAEDFGKTDSGRMLLEKAAQKNIPITHIKRGDVLKINDELTLSVIMPDRKILEYTDEASENDSSLLLKLSYGDTSFLFTGDLSEKSEDYAARFYGEELRADVLKVSHHGSDTSNSKKFLELVGPTYAYIFVGENNMYNHPSQTVIDRLNEMDIIYYRADIQKDVTFYFDKHKIKGIVFEK